MNRLCFINKMLVLFVLIGVIGFAGSYAALAQPTTTMEYKGYLEEDGAAVNARRQFRVFLTTDSTHDWGGVAVVWRGTLGYQQVTNGHFTLTFSPDRAALENGVVYLRIQVARAANQYRTLEGAQQLRAAPHASTARYASDARNAENAQNAVNATGSALDFRVGRDLVVQDDVTVRDNLTIQGDLSVWGTTTHTGRVTHVGNVTTNGSTTQRNVTTTGSTTQRDVTTNGTSTLNGNVRIVGAGADGPDDVDVALKISSPNNQRMVIDGDEIDSNQALQIQPSGGTTIVRGPLEVRRRFPHTLRRVIRRDWNSRDQPQNVNLGSMNDRFCYLAGMHVIAVGEPGEGAGCLVDPNGTDWWLLVDSDGPGHQNPNRAQDGGVQCTAICIIYGDR